VTLRVRTTLKFRRGGIESHLYRTVITSVLWGTLTHKQGKRTETEQTSLFELANGNLTGTGKRKGVEEGEGC